MNRTIKFRAWDKGCGRMFYPEGITIQELLDAAVVDYKETDSVLHWTSETDSVFLEYTGLKDSEGKEIYELHEINNKYRVVYEAPSYVLQDISNGDIINVYDEQYKNGLKITGEYSEL